MRVGHLEVAGVGDDAGECGSGRGLGAAEVDLIFLGARSAREVAGDGAQADLIRCRRLPHTDATHTARLMDACAGGDQLEQVALGVERLERLP